MSLKVSRQACKAPNPCSGVGSNVSGCLSNLKSGNVGSSKYTLLNYAADDLKKMYEAMPEDVKKDLKISDSYRPLKTQCDIFDWDYYERTKKRRKKGTSGTPVATPGGSNHGWGRALDLSGKKAQNWIKENGYKFGWCWGEVTSEPWHFTYCGEGPNKSNSCSKFCKGPKETSPSISNDSDKEESTDDLTLQIPQDNDDYEFSDLLKSNIQNREEKYNKLFKKYFGENTDYGLKKRSFKLNEEISRMRKLF